MRGVWFHPPETHRPARVAAGRNPVECFLGIGFVLAGNEQMFTHRNAHIVRASVVVMKEAGVGMTLGRVSWS